MKQLRHHYKLLALLMFGLFLLLGLYGFYSISGYGTRWFSSTHNPRIAAQKENVIAGDILDRNGVILATTDNDGSRVYQADAEARRAVVHVLGDPAGNVSNGVETFQIGYLYGFETSVTDLFSRLFSSETRRGDNITLTLDSTLNTKIVRCFGSHDNTKDRCGAAVVLNWRTGEVIALVSLPVFDPLHISTESLPSGSQPFWNRATQGKYPPGSTFKTVTLAAVLQDLPDAQRRTFSCTGSLKVMQNIVLRDFGNEIHGGLSLKDAFRLSCNSVFASLSLELGDKQLRREAEHFGFNDNFLFRDLVVENSVYPAGERSDFEVAMSGLGQSALQATPLHMCLIAAGIANDGVMMEPRLLKEIRSSGGGVRLAWSENIYRRACDAETAATIQQYMKSVVQDGGSGFRANVNDMDIRGKTGTAESSLDGKEITYGWFVGYSALRESPYALCVLVEDIPAGESGGTTATVIARDIFEALK